MKNLKIVTLLCAFGVFSCFTTSAQKKEWLKASTPVFAELKAEISSEDAEVGQLIEFTVKDEVLSENNVPLVSSGAAAYGRVKRITEYEMEIEIQFVKSVTGKMIDVEAPPLKRRRTRRQCCVIFDQYTAIPARVKSNISFNHY